VSDQPINPYAGGGTGGSGPAGSGRRRPASVVLRDQGTATTDLATLMDPATKSLADALRITYRILQLGMGALVVVFLFSGVRSVQTTEKGVRLELGRVDADDLAPGLHISLPAPFGELVTVPSGNQTIKLEGEFWPGLREEDRKKSPQELKNSPRGKLDPATDGSLITADGNLAHARFTVSFRRDKVRDYLATIADAAQAERMVRAAVQRGAVHAASTVSIDEFLKDQPDAGRRIETFRAMATTTREVAQQTLDQMRTGIVLTEMTIQDRTPPIDTIKDFEKVQTEQSKAAEMTQAAEQERVKRLSQAAGQAAEPLLRLIDRYDLALVAHDAGAPTLFEKIQAVLDGKPAELDGVKLEAVVGGEAAARLSAAREYRASSVTRAQAAAQMFRVKLDSFHKNPSVLIAGEWTEAFRAFTQRDGVEVLVLPPGSRSVQLLLNSDPALRKQQAIADQQRAARQRMEEDNKRLEKGKFESEKKPDVLTQ